MEQEVGRFQTEIILFVILAACVILMASNFGAGGFVGDAISNFCFGLMGLMAYLFPIVFFLESAFILIMVKYMAEELGISEEVIIKKYNYGVYNEMYGFPTSKARSM